VELLEGLVPGPELAMAYSNLSQLDMLAGRNDEALAWGGRAIDLAESLGQTGILVHALNNVGTVDWCQGRPAGQRTLERSLALALADGLEGHAARAYTNLAYSAINLRHYLAASRYLDEGVRYCTEHDLDTWRLYMLASQARFEFEGGRWTAATRTIETVLSDPRTATISRIEALTVLGRLRARWGDPGVWPLLDEALALATVTGELQRLGPVAIARAEAAWLEGDPAPARAVVETRSTWPRCWRWSPRGCATPISPGACSSPPRRSTTTSQPSWPSSACGPEARRPGRPLNSASTADLPRWGDLPI
jgi:hypothetical protein